jgi:hypothetical protein
VRLDLSEIRNVLANVEQLLGAHDGEQLRPAHRRVGPLQRSDIETSALLNDLRLAQEFLQLAGAEIAAAGWRIAGHEDPRQSRRSRAAAGSSMMGDINSRAGTAPKTINLVTRQMSITRAERPSALPRQGV